jgi:NitT/TauT family transport system substrate-binding protein
MIQKPSVTAGTLHVAALGLILSSLVTSAFPLPSARHPHRSPVGTQCPFGMMGPLGATGGAGAQFGAMLRSVSAEGVARTPSGNKGGTVGGRAMVRALIAAAAILLGLCGATGAAEGRPHVKIAIGGAACLCYLPTVLAQALGAYEAVGLDVELINVKGGSSALAAVLGGSADVVSGYYDHCIDIVPKGKALTAFVAYDRFPGLALVVSPKAGGAIASIKDLAGMKVGVTAPGSSTDFFLRYALGKNGVAADKVAVIGVGVDATAVAAMEQGLVDAAVMLDPAITALKARHPDLRFLADTRGAEDTHALFGGDYPGGVLYAQPQWIAAHGAETQRLADALVATLRWLHGHSAEEIVAKMPKELVGDDPALYLAALKNALPMYSATGLMDAKGAQAVLDVLAQSEPAVAAAHIDLAKTYTNEFVEKASLVPGLPQ